MSLFYSLDLSLPVKARTSGEIWLNPSGSHEPIAPVWETPPTHRDIIMFSFWPSAHAQKRRTHSHPWTGSAGKCILPLARMFFLVSVSVTWLSLMLCFYNRCWFLFSLHIQALSSTVWLLSCKVKTYHALLLNSDFGLWDIGFFIIILSQNICTGWVETSVDTILPVERKSSI